MLSKETLNRWRDEALEDIANEESAGAYVIKELNNRILRSTQELLNLYIEVKSEIEEKRSASLQACEETIELWTEMARVAREKEKAVEKWEVPGPWIYYFHECPCCEYSRKGGNTLCGKCPMGKEWLVYGATNSAPCEDPKSPYKQWLDLLYKAGAFCIDVEFFCLLIVEMAEEAIERLRKE